MWTFRVKNPPFTLFYDGVNIAALAFYYLDITAAIHGTNIMPVLANRVVSYIGFQGLAFQQNIDGSSCRNSS